MRYFKNKCVILYQISELMDYLFLKYRIFLVILHHKNEYYG